MRRTPRFSPTGSLLALVLLVTAPAPLLARPILTESVEPIEKWSFETEFAPSQRWDEFTEPETDYESVTLPVRFAIGLPARTEAGFSVTHYAQRLKRQSLRLSGSSKSRFSPYLKWSPSRYLGLVATYHESTSELEGEELPVTFGQDWEAALLFRIPGLSWMQFNAGHVWRGNYDSKFGVAGAPSAGVEPGDVAYGRASLEIPLRFGLALLAETVYTAVQERFIDGRRIPDSDGEAMDALAGVTWSRGGWNIGLGAAFGLLDESHTSFAIDRGAGDVQAVLSLAYRLRPRQFERGDW